MWQSYGKIALIFLIGLSFMACGVKTDPVPPESPAEMSRAKPADNSDPHFLKKDKKDSDSEEN